VSEQLEILPGECRIVADFKSKADDFQAVLSIFLLKFFEERRFIQAVVTPGAHDVDDQGLASEPFISIADGFTGWCNTRKCKLRARIFHRGLLAGRRLYIQIGTRLQIQIHRLIVRGGVKLAMKASVPGGPKNDRNGLPTRKT